MDGFWYRGTFLLCHDRCFFFFIPTISRQKSINQYLYNKHERERVLADRPATAAAIFHLLRLQPPTMRNEIKSRASVLGRVMTFATIDARSCATRADTPGAARRLERRKKILSDTYSL